MSLTLEKFDCDGDPTSLVARWERWKRALQIYLLAASIENNEKKKACLLHFGGQELQEVFFNIPDGSNNQEETSDVFKSAIEKLDTYFAPKQSKVYEKLVKRDIIEEVNGSSKWVSPIVPILKENGDVRICVDMRRANAAIIRENHPLPTMDKLLPRVRDAKYFSKLDIRDAFHQLELHPDARHITTFITSRGLFRYKRLMFGITCAPEIFQKTIERILLDCDGVRSTKSAFLGPRVVSDGSETTAEVCFIHTRL